MTNIYAKLAEARKQFHSLKLQKTGHNKFAGYNYFELSDFVIPGMDCLRENGLVPVVRFGPDCATMDLHETDGDGSIKFECPNSEANLKGCHPIQNLGAVQTYQRRYLWVAALEIVEHDAIDSSPQVEQPEPISDKTYALLQDLADGDDDRMAFFHKRGKSLTEEQAQKVVEKWAA